MARPRRMTRTPLALLAVATLVLVACGESDPGAASADDADDTASDQGADADGIDTIGFIFVGPADDVGYNQAAYEGSEAVAAAFPDLEVLQVENVPETSEAEQVMADLVASGADLIFATSFGHLEFAATMAERHPDVVFVHQGGLKGEHDLDNLGTYFGTVYEPVYTAGIAAGAASETGRLGFVYAFAIPQTLANINAFTLGAQSVNPDIETVTIATGNWCDPGLQAEAANSLIGEGVDVITQHQDCTRTIIETAENAGIHSVGYHADASDLAPEGWLTGSEWDWSDIYVDIVETVAAGEFASSPYAGDFRGSMAEDTNPFVQSDFGPSVDAETISVIEETQQRFVDGGSPFEGPVVDQGGELIVPEGEQATTDEIEQMDYFVEGVVGSLD